MFQPRPVHSAIFQASLSDGEGSTGVGVYSFPGWVTVSFTEETPAAEKVISAVRLS